MENENKVLACVDQSRFANAITDYATWAAQRMQAPLELLHIIDRHPERSTTKDRSGTIGFNAQERLLNKLCAQDERYTKAMREQGRLFLNCLRERALARGVTSVDIRQRHGELKTTLVEQESQVRLLVLGRRGETTEATHHHLGQNVERIVRALHNPLLSVKAAFQEPKRIMIAFDGSDLTRRGIERVANSPLFQGLPIHVLMSGKTQADAKAQLEWATQTLSSAGFKTTSALIPGVAEEVITHELHNQAIDLLVMGAYTHSPWRNLFLGSKTSEVMRTSSLPILLLR
ncbi:nucleotide-binding universal stress UspA family protein [Azomonas agilis]|uniref:Nucleotide-binding universal stress UspA family protein n=1 Tax=Azomonas agilis TaxID=116849 RepID=A0A562I1X4_9GAMM|nr:universal stress protein [Azomonas agilis]TWH65041.1 nucleotide-binding universal stress UspA family protein [Azomonas agilis]